MGIRKLDPDAPVAGYAGDNPVTSVLGDWVTGLIADALAPLAGRLETLEARADRDWRPPTVDTEGACRMLCCGVDKLRALRNSGEIVYYDYMSNLVYDVASLEAFLARHRVPSETPLTARLNRRRSDVAAR